MSTENLSPITLDFEIGKDKMFLRRWCLNLQQQSMIMVKRYALKLTGGDFRNGNEM
jgi:hypothetical protein